MTQIRAGGHVIGEHGWEVASATPSPAEVPEPAFNPSDHRISDVLEYIEDNPDATSEVLEAEKAGKHRATLIEALEGDDD